MISRNLKVILMFVLVFAAAKPAVQVWSTGALEQIAVDRIADGDPINRVNLLYTIDGDRIRIDRTQIVGSINPDPV